MGVPESLSNFAGANIGTSIDTAKRNLHNLKIYNAKPKHPFTKIVLRKSLTACFSQNKNQNSTLIECLLTITKLFKLLISNVFICFVCVKVLVWLTKKRFRMSFLGFAIKLIVVKCCYVGI